MAQHANRGLVIDAGTSRSRWLGEGMDYSIAVEALCWQQAVHRRDSDRPIVQPLDAMAAR